VSEVQKVISDFRNFHDPFPSVERVRGEWERGGRSEGREKQNVKMLVCGHYYTAFTLPDMYFA
jgi:hypothetical protein